MSPMDTAPKDGTKIDLFLGIPASPRSFGWADSFWVPHCWWDGKGWVHMHRGQPTALDPSYISGWADAGSQQTDYRAA